MVEVDSGSFFFFGKLAEIFFKKGVLVGDGASNYCGEHYEQNP